jgi:hypothetical protein
VFGKANYYILTIVSRAPVRRDLFMIRGICFVLADPQAG